MLPRRRVAVRPDKISVGSASAIRWTPPRAEDDMAKRSTAKKTARKPNAAFMKPMNPSPALAEVVGSKAIPRTEVTKKLWAYIKKNKLQDAKNKRMIKADDALKPVFGGKSTVNMFEMTRLVNKHLK
jgi:upstream activation factor subunit UAF30